MSGETNDPPVYRENSVFNIPIMWIDTAKPNTSNPNEI